jgi:hypothetical protein
MKPRAFLGAALIAASLSVAPTAGGTAAASPLDDIGPAGLYPRHVNSNVEFTWLYETPYGAEHHDVQLSWCYNFWSDRSENGRYHHVWTSDQPRDGWVSHDRAGPGHC